MKVGVGESRDQQTVVSFIPQNGDGEIQALEKLYHAMHLYAKTVPMLSAHVWAVLGVSCLIRELAAFS